MHENGAGNRLVLLILVAVVVTVLVLASAWELLPPPPGSPTPNMLDWPDGRLRLRH